MLTSDSDSASRVVVLSGRGGLGKTTLACALVRWIHELIERPRPGLQGSCVLVAPDAGRVTADFSSLRFGRLAIVVVSDALFGMLRMFHALSEAAFSDAQIFRDRDQALQWLDETVD